MLPLSWCHFSHTEKALVQARQMPLWGYRESSYNHLHDTRYKEALVTYDPQRMILSECSSKQV